MIQYPFGTKFNLTWQYQPSFPPTDEPESIYIFSDAPTMAIAKAGTGALHTISSWIVATDNAYAKTFEVPAISDPNPTDGVTEVSYWVAINYLLEDTEQEQTDLFEITLKRNRGNLVGEEANLTNVKEIFPEITSYASDAQITNYIKIAKAQVESDFKKKGIEYNSIRNLNDFWLGNAYKVISLIGLAEFKEEGDRHFVRYTQFAKLYDDHMRDLKVEIDTNQDGSIDTNKVPNLSYLVNNK